MYRYEGTMLSEVSQTNTVQSHMWNLKKERKFIENRLVVVGGGSGEGQKVQTSVIKLLR